MESIDKRKSSAASGTQFMASAITYRPPALLANGEMSVCQNFRNTYPGIRKRLGLEESATLGVFEIDRSVICCAEQYYPSATFVGYRDGVSDNSVNLFEFTAKGEGYEVGDILTLDGGNSDCTVRVDRVSSSPPIGEIQLFSLLTSGSGYTLGGFYPCLGGHGSGAVAVTTRVSSGDARSAPATLTVDNGLTGTVEAYANGSQKTFVRTALIVRRHSSDNGGDFISARLSIKPETYGAGLPKICLVSFEPYPGIAFTTDPYGCTTGIDYSPQDYQGFFEMDGNSPVFTLASDDIIDTSALSPDEWVSFVINAHGITRLNTVGGYPRYEFGIIEYESDYLGGTPPNGVRSTFRFGMLGCDVEDNDPPRFDGVQWREADMPTSIYQFSKTRGSMVSVIADPAADPPKESHTFFSTKCGDIRELPDIPLASPPTTYPAPLDVVGSWNTYSSEPVCLPSWGSVGDVMVISSGTQHVLYAGETCGVKGAWVGYTENFDEGVDIWDSIQDGWSAYDVSELTDNLVGILICTQTPAKHFDLDIIASDPTVSAARVKCLDSFTGWVEGTVSSDTTIDGAGSLGKSGRITFSGGQVPAFPSEFFGITGFWYRIIPTTSFQYFSLAQLTYGNTSFEPLVNVWDGMPVDILEAQVYFPAAPPVSEAYYTYPASLISANALPVGGAIYLSSTDPVVEWIVDVGASPNKAQLREIDSIEYWDGTGFQPLSFEDSTECFAHSGRITITTPEAGYIPEASKFNGSQLASIWYKITPTHALSDTVSISVTYSPRIKSIRKQFGLRGMCNCVWKDRVAYTFDRYGSDIYVTAGGTPNVLNGNDYAILGAGDGRKNRVNVMKKFHNEIMVWQEELGQEGGCLTLFEGYSPATFGKLLLSSKVGCVNSPQACVVVDGSAAQVTRKDDNIQTRAYWVSHYGIYSSDGRTVSRISNDIQNYFDPRDPMCIRRGYEWASFAQYDSSENVVRFGLVCGGDSKVCNIFPVYDLTTGTWSFDQYSLGRGLTAMAEVSSMSGDAPVLQLAGSANKIYRANVGLNDDGEAIEAIARSEMNSSATLMDLREVMVRMKVQAGGTCRFSAYENGRLVTEHDEDIAMDAVEPGDTILRERLIKNVNQVHNISFEFSNDEVDIGLSLYDYFIDYNTLGER